MWKALMALGVAGALASGGALFFVRSGAVRALLYLAFILSVLLGNVAWRAVRAEEARTRAPD